jgi:hypothetical protein
MDMRTIRFFILSLLTGLSSANSTVAKEWRGIKPLSSTRADVERLLGSPQQSTPYASFYNLSDEIAVVGFQAGPCDEFGLGWKVPVGTVINVGVIPKAKHLKEKFFSGSEFEAYKAEGGFLYYSDQNGMSVETFKGIATVLDYAPTAQEEVRRCPRVQECCFDFFPRFDEYADISFEEEKARLDNYVINMKERMSRGVIVIYGPSTKARAQLMKRASRAQKYLAQTRGIEKHRVLIVDGGYKERSAIELNLHSIGGLGSRVNLFPQLDPE